MPDADGNLSPEEEQDVETLYVEVRAWGIEAADRTSHGAAASAMILAGMHAYEDAMGTSAIAELLTELAEGARAKAEAGPSGEHRH
ncbi:MAG: hypothetical protein WAP03_12870 [Methylorubrum rhodinum]|uniref:hypothetical protein n=1 Tax=Methylorubrum rhodinum TaxID=29428 RepID=UPI003BB0831D